MDYGPLKDTKNDTIGRHVRDQIWRYCSTLPLQHPNVKKRLRSKSDQAGGKIIFVLEFITKDQIDGSYMILCRAVLQIVHVLYKETSKST